MSELPCGDQKQWVRSFNLSCCMLTDSSFCVFVQRRNFYGVARCLWSQSIGLNSNSVDFNDSTGIWRLQMHKWSMCRLFTSVCQEDYIQSAQNGSIITATSKWARRRLESPASRLLHNRVFRRRSKETSQLCVTGLFHRWIPHTKGQ